LYLYEKGNHKIRIVSPEKAAVIKGYYSIDPPGLDIDENAVESYLSFIESHCAPVIRKMQNKEELSSEDREKFSVFLGFMLIRVPQFRTASEDLASKTMKSLLMTLASDKEEFEREYKAYQKQKGSKNEVPIEKIREFILDKDKYEINSHPNVSLAFMELGIKVAPIFLDMKWSFWEATEDHKYLTSDNPLYYFDRTAPSNAGVGLLNRNIEVYFPVSRDIMFLGCWHNVQGYRRLNNSQLKGWNKNTTIFATRFVFSPQYSQGINRIVQGYINSAPKIELVST